MGEKGEGGYCLWVWLKGHLGKEWTEEVFEDEDKRIVLVERDTRLEWFEWKWERLTGSDETGQSSATL